MSPRSSGSDIYLGDGVYASWDGYHIILDTRAQYPVQRIALDPSVYRNLVDFATELSRQLRNRAKETDHGTTE